MDLHHSVSPEEHGGPRVLDTPTPPLLRSLVFQSSLICQAWLFLSGLPDSGFENTVYKSPQTSNKFLFYWSQVMRALARLWFESWARSQLVNLVPASANIYCSSSHHLKPFRFPQLWNRQRTLPQTFSPSFCHTKLLLFCWGQNIAFPTIIGIKQKPFEQGSCM